MGSSNETSAAELLTRVLPVHSPAGSASRPSDGPKPNYLPNVLQLSSDQH